MPLYRATVYDAKGNLKTLRNEAANDADLLRDLAGKGYVVVDVEREKASRGLTGRKKNLRLDHLLLFCTTMAVYLRSGLSLTEVLKLLQKQTRDKSLKPVLSELREGVESGRSLSAAMRESGVFRTTLVGMVESGEKSSSLAEILERAAELYQNEISLRRKIQSSLTYPMVMFFVGVLVVVFLLSYVVPRITELFEDTGQALPLITQALLLVSATVRIGFIPFVIACVLGYFYLRKKGRTISIPFFVDIKRNLTFSLVFSQIATLLKTGVPLVQALELSASLDSDKNRLHAVAGQVREGYRFSQSLEREGSFPEEIVSIIRVGEMGGNLPQSLEQIGRSSWEFAQTGMQKWANLAEPMIILFLGLIVGFVVLAVLLPIFNLSTLN